MVVVVMVMVMVCVCVFMHVYAVGKWGIARLKECSMQRVQYHHRPRRKGEYTLSEKVKHLQMIRTYGTRDEVEREKSGWRIRLKADHEEPWDFQGIYTNCEHIL